MKYIVCEGISSPMSMHVIVEKYNVMYNLKHYTLKPHQFSFNSHTLCEMAGTVNLKKKNKKIYSTYVAPSMSLLVYYPTSSHISHYLIERLTSNVTYIKSPQYSDVEGKELKRDDG